MDVSATTRRLVPPSGVCLPVECRCQFARPLHRTASKERIRDHHGVRPQSVQRANRDPLSTALILSEDEQALAALGVCGLQLNEQTGGTVESKSMCAGQVQKPRNFRLG